jgi:hypothetical protein
MPDFPLGVGSTAHCDGWIDSYVEWGKMHYEACRRKGIIRQVGSV